MTRLVLVSIAMCSVASTDVPEGGSGTATGNEPESDWVSFQIFGFIVSAAILALILTTRIWRIRIGIFIGLLLGGWVAWALWHIEGFGALGAGTFAFGLYCLLGSMVNPLLDKARSVLVPKEWSRNLIRVFIPETPVHRD